MAAYAALYSLEQTIDRLQHHHSHRYPISPHDKQQFMFIHDFITLVQSFLRDFPEKANSLEGRIRDVATEAEDIIEFDLSDQIKLYHILKSTEGHENVKRWLISDLKELKKVTNKIDSIRGEVMEIIKKSTRAKDVQLRTAHSSVATSSSRPIAPTNTDPMVGFGDHLMAVKVRLRGESRNLEFIPIFGMGGIGKTTLARNAYEDLSIVEYFDIRAWITVSQDYTAQEILSSLLASMKAKRSEGRIQSMAQDVYQHLKYRRYLIVIDDIWSIQAWDDMRVAFPNEQTRSRIILTTRLSEVATYPDPFSPIHKMHFMNVDQSWNLLQQKVFPQENCPRELEAIGKTIARSCGGLPLAIALIAGLLSTVTRTQASWENIAENINLAISSANDEQFARILSLSYTHLPHHLRPCFLYIGCFPEDHQICASKLIKLWVAEGFSKQSGSKSFEEVAEEYLEDLVKRSLIFVTGRKSNDKIKSCSVHDLVRDLCIGKAQEEMFNLNVQYAGKIHLESIKSQRRVTVSYSDMRRLENISGSTIRTIICFHHHGGSLSYLRNSRLLRVLDVVVPEIDYDLISNDLIYMTEDYYTGDDYVFPAEVSELFHLRYLAFNYISKADHSILVVPPSILNLQNLQTLIIHPPNICALPMEIWRMRQLRHLIFNGHLPNIPEGAPKFPLENLQTLSEVDHFKCTEEIVKMIPNLNTLKIFYPYKWMDDDVEDWMDDDVEDYHLNNLVNLHRLEKLTLYRVRPDSSVWKLNPVLPSTLKELSLHGDIIASEDMGIVSSLPNLQVLKLVFFEFDDNKWETSEGEFPRLKFLLIDSSSLHQWITESSHFPNLKRLVLNNLEKLREIPDGIGEIPTLELIEVDRQNKSLLDSAKKLQEKQAEDSGNTTFQVRQL